MKTARREYHDLVGSDGFVRESLLRLMEQSDGSILLETTLPDRSNQRSFIFTKPSTVFQAQSLGEVESCLRNVEEGIQDGYHAAGFLCYETGFAFEEALNSPIQSDVPLVWFGLYRQPIVLNHRTKRIEEGRSLAGRLALDQKFHSAWNEPSNIRDVRTSMGREAYRSALEKIRRYLEEGDTYQVNFTFKLRFGFDGTPAGIYKLLRPGQRVGYAALINAHSKTVLSFSPELLFRLQRSAITLKPMKGTAPRGRTLEEDEKQRLWLSSSEKNRAENRMIVDLLRNDIGRCAKTGSVSVSRFFDVEKYETVLQATSTIRANVGSRTGLVDLVRSLFPSGSVTGAPKIRTMQIIQELEREPRGVYTGAIGFFSPRRNAVFNVAIRTVVLDKETQTGEYGIGSGVTHDSETADEYEECLLKARFLTEPVEEFQLIETMQWDGDSGWFLLSLHLKRLQHSAKYFSFAYDRMKVLTELQNLGARLKYQKRTEGPYLVRLTLERGGQINLDARPLDDMKAAPQIEISAHRTNSSDRFLYHKTSHRRLYDSELERTKATGAFDVLFLNERDEVTEGARSNILVRMENTSFTPPITCGVLPGTFRTHMLRTKQYNLEEKVLHWEDLLAAEEILLCNAVRGMVSTKLRMEK